MSNYQSMILFYVYLAELFRVSNQLLADHPLIQLVIAGRKKMKGSAFKELELQTVVGMIHAHAHGGEGRIEWIRGAFCDLAPHMRDPAARMVFADLLEVLRFDHKDLFLWQKNVRLLGKDQNGPAAVTLVVSNYANFENLITSAFVADSEVTNIHLAKKVV